MRCGWCPKEPNMIEKDNSYVCPKCGNVVPKYMEQRGRKPKSKDSTKLPRE